MQRDRRRDPYPWTWEIPAAGALAGFLLVVVSVHLARGVANLIAGAGWTWPATDSGRLSSGPLGSPLGSSFWTSLPGVLSGDAAAGLAAHQAASDLAGATLLWVCLVAIESIALAAGVGAAVYGYRRWGPGRMMGMATAAEAEALLGVTRLRKAAAIVRPDLYGPQPVAAIPAVHREAGEASNVPLGQGLSPWLQPARRRKGEPQ